ncbi:MAG: hypothetical protein CME71_09400 [Halobacteriovorax sp.]|nr:hypothetical protein [Halobacteriovorax sp.]|tara:strand:- start:467 stop:1126 length:660 start_codon:yes stop_codon:yes gene_type:complete
MKKIILALLFPFIAHSTAFEDSIKVRSFNKSALSLELRLLEFEQVFSPVVKAQANWDLRVKIRREEMTFNAYATFSDDNEALILVNNGLLAHSEMNVKLLDLFLCHELGHLLGGAPKIIRRNGKTSWSSVEGQSDYYASSVCMPILGHANSEVIEISYQMVKIFAELRGARNLPSLEAKDESTVSKTIQGHPNLQCRLDTLMAGLNLFDRPRCWYNPSE